MQKMIAKCPCLKSADDEVVVLDYRHKGLCDVPNEVFMFERTLEELYLDSNQIRDLPRALFLCHGLRKLGISDNEIQSLPPAVASLINLEELDISKNGILSFPDNIKGCKCLTVVEASVNPLGKLPEGFTQLINLEELYLNDTFLDYLPANFGRLSKLRILELRENNLKSLPKSMARLVELKCLDIGQNDFTELPEVIGSLHKLQELWFDFNQICFLPPFLGNLHQLKYLDSSNNNIERIATEVKNCCALSDVAFSGNCLESIPEIFENLKNLTSLKLDDNQLKELPLSLGCITNLEELIVNQNNMKTLPARIGLLRKLHILNLDSNLLEELPPEIGSCSGLTILSVRGNKLKSVPHELGHISYLRVLNLSNNLIQNLPFSMTKLHHLQALWLSDNQNKPLVPLQSDIDPTTGQRVLTCFLLPQQPIKESQDVESDSDSFHPSLWEEERRRKQHIKFAPDEHEQLGKRIRSASPYPKELKARARHEKNEALKMKQYRNNLQSPKQIQSEKTVPYQSHIASQNFLPSEVQVKEAKVTKPKSPNTSPVFLNQFQKFNEKLDSSKIEKLKTKSWISFSPIFNSNDKVLPSEKHHLTDNCQSFLESTNSTVSAMSGTPVYSNILKNIPAMLTKTVSKEVLQTRKLSVSSPNLQINENILKSEYTFHYLPPTNEESKPLASPLSLSQNSASRKKLNFLLTSNDSKLDENCSSSPDVDCIGVSLSENNSYAVKDQLYGGSHEMSNSAAVRTKKPPPYHIAAAYSKRVGESSTSQYPSHFKNISYSHLSTENLEVFQDAPSPLSDTHSNSNQGNNKLSLKVVAEANCSTSSHLDLSISYSPSLLQYNEDTFYHSQSHSPSLFSSHSSIAAEETVSDPLKLEHYHFRGKFDEDESNKKNKRLSAFPSWSGAIDSIETHHFKSPSRTSSVASIPQSLIAAKCNPSRFTQDKPMGSSELPLIIPTPQRPKLTKHSEIKSFSSQSSINEALSSSSLMERKKQSWFLGLHKNPLVFPVTIQKSASLGFNISRSSHPNLQKSGIYITSIEEGSSASYTLEVGDKILEVNGQDFTNVSTDEALLVLNSTGPTVSLMISRNDARRPSC